MTLTICITILICTLIHSVLLGIVAFKILELAQHAVEKFDSVDVDKHITVRGGNDG